MQPHLYPPTKSPRGGWGGEGPKYQHPDDTDGQPGLGAVAENRL